MLCGCDAVHRVSKRTIIYRAAIELIVLSIFIITVYVGDRVVDSIGPEGPLYVQRLEHETIHMQFAAHFNGDNAIFIVRKIPGTRIQDYDVR